MHPTLIILLLFLLFSCNPQQETSWDTPGNHNPLVPGYFADPTIKKFGDTYYIYSTTDGVKLASGEPTVWISKNLVDWYNAELDIELPEGLTNCWAPDVMKGKDGKYYYYMGNCQNGCNIYGYVADHPVGPWKPLNEGVAVIPVGTGSENLPALDAQFLKCENGDIYSFFGTWCHIFQGLGWAKIAGDDMYTIEESGYVPNEQLPHLFEAIYPMERNGKYILMYSSGDCRKSDYAVHYAYADHPTGPYTYGQNNPILENNSDFTIDGPGHHSMLELAGEYYIFYHRHDNPHSSGGMFRQIAVDQLHFLNDSTIEKIIPTHTGIADFGLGNKHPENLALNGSAQASSQYHLVADKTPYTRDSTNYLYEAGNAIDDNNGTLWMAASSALPQSLTVDFGKSQSIKCILTQFQYATYYYRYIIEVSQDNENWQLFADRTDNRVSGSPMVDDLEVTARFIRWTITGTEKQGMLAAIWNVKVYDELFDLPDIDNLPSPDGPAPLASQELEVAFDPGHLPIGPIEENIQNQGRINGVFKPIGHCQIREVEGVKALYLNGNAYLELSKPAPNSMDWNAPFTVSAWIYAEEITPGKCIMSWNTRDNMLQASYAALMYGSGPYGAMAHGDGYVDVGFNEVPETGRWHQITVTFDGMLETIYVNGVKDSTFPLHLFVDADTVRIGSSGVEQENFVGYIANAQLYNKAMTPEEVREHFADTHPVK